MPNKYPSKLNVETGASSVSPFSTDRDTKIGHTPAAVAKLRDSDEVVDLIKWANKNAVSLIPVSSTGDRRRGDTVPADEGVVVADLTEMRALKHADKRDKIAIIEPGVDFASIDGLLSPYGLRAHRPLKPRAGKSVVASYLDREPITSPDDHWDVSDPMGGTSLVLGSGDFVLTGGAAVEGSLEDQITRGNRHMLQTGPSSIDLLRVAQGAQGSLGIMTWAAVYCERIPAVEKSWFACADNLEAVMNMARDILHRRISTTLFIVDNTQLALLMGGDAAKFLELSKSLPDWTLFITTAGIHHDPEEKVQWQSEEIAEYAQQYGVELHEQLQGNSSTAFASNLRKTETESYKDRPYGAHKELFFLRSYSKAGKAVSNMRDFVTGSEFSSQPIGTYIQPMVQGVYSHVEFTFPYQPQGGEQIQKVNAFWRSAAKACASSGAFFSRPYFEWSELAFESNTNALKMLNSTKSLLDPNNIMNPKRFPYGSERL